MLSGQLGVIICAIFLLLVLGGLLVQHLVNSMLREISMAEYELERGPIEQAPTPGGGIASGLLHADLR